MANILTSIIEMRQWSRQQRQAGLRVALVPTMGALHQGHWELVREAQRRADSVVVSIFVNPLQFGPHEDLANYPRQLAEDVAALTGLGVPIVFSPATDEMYPQGSPKTRVAVDSLAAPLCGRSRPGHFQGVVTVVAKLLHIVEPQVAVFGQKDWQQLAIIRQLVKDLNYDVEVVGVPIVREGSGLALSSRNRYLSLEEKVQASSIYGALHEAAESYQPLMPREALRQMVLTKLRQADIAAEYVEVVDPETLEESPAALNGAALIAVAARVGKARLIDNVLVGQD